MTTTINASNSGNGGLIQTADASGVLALQTAGTTALSIDASQNVGIGTTTIGQKLVIESNSSQLRLRNSTTRYRSDYTVDSSGNMEINSYDDTGSAYKQIKLNGIPLIFSVGSEAMRIDSSGIVLVGATAARTTQAKLELRSAANTALSLYMFKDTQVEATLGFKSSTDSNFYVGSGSTSVGTNGVYLTNTGSSWNAVSDERMKTILEPIENASAKVATLRTVMGYYNADTTQTRRPFLIAQDVQAVLPEAVNIQDVETGTLGMSYTDTIPLLVAAIKEQQALIISLTARIAALEGTPA